MNATVTFDDRSEATIPTRDQHRAHQPVAEVGGEHDARSRARRAMQRITTWLSEKRQRDRVDAQGRQVLAQHDVEVVGRQRQEQLVGPLPPLVGPRRSS